MGAAFLAQQRSRQNNSFRNIDGTAIVEQIGAVTWRQRSCPATQALSRCCCSILMRQSKLLIRINQIRISDAGAV